MSFAALNADANDSQVALQQSLQVPGYNSPITYPSLSN